MQHGCCAPVAHQGPCCFNKDNLDDSLSQLFFPVSDLYLDSGDKAARFAQAAQGEVIAGAYHRVGGPALYGITWSFRRLSRQTRRPSWPRPAPLERENRHSLPCKNAEAGHTGQPAPAAKE